MYLVYSPKFLEHYQGYMHVDNPERLIEIKNYLDKNLKYAGIEAKMADEKDLMLAHTKEHIDKMKAYSDTNTNFPDNKFNRNTYDIARIAVGAAINAAQVAFAKKQLAFALVRPPGHHAGKDFFGGFCYMNNLAIAIRKLKKKTLIIDIDVHHGNGTQDIFCNDKNVFFLSIHQHPATLYPGTGYDRENSDHVLNIPLEPGTGDSTYLERLGEAIQKVKKAKFHPQLVAISAGFDTWTDDPIANIDIKDSKTYFKIGKMINDNFKCPKFACLEGGYYLPKLGENVYNFIKAFL